MKPKLDPPCAYGFLAPRRPVGHEVMSAPSLLTSAPTVPFVDDATPLKDIDDVERPHKFTIAETILSAVGIGLMAIAGYGLVRIGIWLIHHHH